MVHEKTNDLANALECTAQVLPILITARCQEEGGLEELSPQQRSSLLERFLDFASWVDIEVNSAQSMESILKTIQTKQKKLILSSHNFQTTPPPSSLRKIFTQASDLGADIAKIAIQHNTLSDLHSCAHLMQDHFPTPVSMMGMGPLAPVSRVLFSQLGSVLNYGFLGNEATAPGQWSASLLKKAILNSQIIA